MMRIFLGEADRWNEEPLYDAIMKRLRMMDVAGATVYRGILGYGAKGHTHQQNFLHTSRDLPIMIAVVETEEKLNAAAAAIEEMLQDGLIVVSEVDIVRSSMWRHDETTSQLNCFACISRNATAAMASRFTRQLSKNAGNLKIAGATVFRGLEGYGGHG